MSDLSQEASGVGAICLDGTCLVWVGISTTVHRRKHFDIIIYTILATGLLRVRPKSTTDHLVSITALSTPPGCHYLSKKLKILQYGFAALQQLKISSKGYLKMEAFV